MRQRRLPLPRRTRLVAGADAASCAPVRRQRVTAGAARRGSAGAASRVRPQTDRAPDLIVATADPSLGRMLAFALEQMRLPHRSFTSGTALLQTLLDLPTGGHPAVVVLDVDLPGVDGHAILERLGAERPDTFLIVVLSSHADESVQVRSLLAGALDHLAKPFNVRVLMAKLQRLAAVARRCRVAA